MPRDQRSHACALTHRGHDARCPGRPWHCPQDLFRHAQHVHLRRQHGAHGRAHCGPHMEKGATGDSAAGAWPSAPNRHGSVTHPPTHAWWAGPGRVPTRSRRTIMHASMQLCPLRGGRPSRAAKHHTTAAHVQRVHTLGAPSNRVRTLDSNDACWPACAAASTNAMLVLLRARGLRSADWPSWHTHCPRAGCNFPRPPRALPVGLRQQVPPQSGPCQ